ncbi:MAG: helix-turn-helix domain-containing protein [Actinobacteria bacterium]|nr:helix-turn-helix domain-containing protein [Actinomycetota bacterium]
MRCSARRLVLYAAEGLSNVEIGARLQLAPELVGRWRRRFFEQRLDGLSDKPRAGRPRRFPPARGRAGESGRVRATPGSGRTALALQ